MRLRLLWPLNVSNGFQCAARCVLIKTINLATFLVVLWLLWTSSAQNYRITDIERSTQQVYRSVDRRLDDTAESLQNQNEAALLTLAAARPAETNNIGNGALVSELRLEVDNYRNKLRVYERTNQLKVLLQTVMSAEFDKIANPSRAAETLLSTKEGIWQKSLEEEQIQQGLQSLMAPIDILAGEWADGYTANSVSTIYKILNDSIQTLEATGGSQ